ncbi:MAG: hypothetical protein KDE51_23785, partial [Anaerolineales bacterium]|nr:hypothetical protein [Anaerolineales bacterium]
MLRMSHGGEKRPLLVILISLLTIVLTAAISFNLSPYLRGPDEWQWPYAVLGEPQRMILPIIWLGVHIGLGVWWVRTLMARPQKRVGGYLWFMWLSAVLIQTTLLYVTTPVIQQLYFRTVSVGANGVFSVGSTITNPHDFLRQYPELMPTFPIHPQRYPPGLMMLFYGMRQLMHQMPNVAHSIAQELRLLQCTD